MFGSTTSCIGVDLFEEPQPLSRINEHMTVAVKHSQRLGRQCAFGSNESVKTRERNDGVIKDAVIEDETVGWKIDG